MSVQIEEKWTEVQGLRIHYLTGGETGSPVLLVHAGVVDHAALSYRSSLAPLSRRHRLFAPDLPGHGESDKPAMQYLTEHRVDFLGRFMDAMDLETASLVGVSAGGAYALGYGLQAPERVARIVLVGSYGLGAKIPYGALARLLVHLPLSSTPFRTTIGQSEALIRFVLRRIIEDPTMVNAGLVDEIRRAARKPRAGQAWLSWQRSEVGWLRLRTDLTESLPELRVPTVILHGAKDRLVPLAWARRAHSLIRSSALWVFPDCGHWLPRDAPGEFNRALLEALSTESA